MATARKASDSNEADPQVQKVVDEAEDRGLYGVEVDQTPNEHYTVPGQVAGKPVPETDADAKAKATEGS
jgi:hypothetical protein